MLTEEEIKNLIEDAEIKTLKILSLPKSIENGIEFQRLCAKIEAYNEVLQTQNQEAKYDI